MPLISNLKKLFSNNNQRKNKNRFLDIEEYGKIVDQDEYCNLPHNIAWLTSLGEVQISYLEGIGYAARVDERRGYYGCIYEENGNLIDFIKLDKLETLEPRND